MTTKYLEPLKAIENSQYYECYNLKSQKCIEIGYY